MEIVRQLKEDPHCLPRVFLPLDPSPPSSQEGEGSAGESAGGSAGGSAAAPRAEEQPEEKDLKDLKGKGASCQVERAAAVQEEHNADQDGQALSNQIKNLDKT